MKKTIYNIRRSAYRLGEKKRKSKKNRFKRRFFWFLLQKRFLLNIYNGHRFYAHPRVRKISPALIGPIKAPPMQFTTNSNALKRYKLGLKFTKYQRQILFGVMLSDGTMGLSRNVPSYVFKFAQSKKRKRFVVY